MRNILGFNLFWADCWWKKRYKTTLNANQEIDIFIKKYPGTDYAIDLKFKDLVNNQLAAKELFIAKHILQFKMDLLLID